VCLPKKSDVEFTAFVGLKNRAIWLEALSSFYSKTDIDTTLLIIIIIIQPAMRSFFASWPSKRPKPITEIFNRIIRDEKKDVG
jgi:hypothetical protein